MILIAYGTRPEQIKVQPLINLMGDECKVLFTGQHEALRDVDYDYRIRITAGENRLDSIVSSIMYRISIVFDVEPITHVLVQGDTTSALAVALSAFHYGLKVIHMEAGLRTFDNKNPFPEEVNRKMISQIADIHLCPTYWNAENLKTSGVTGRVHIVGNTGLDGLKKHKKECEYGNTVLVTLHRRENHARMDEWFMAVDQLADEHPEFEFIFPIHYNPNVREHQRLLSHVKVIDPLPREALLNILVKCRFVITDSGGLQEECSYFNKMCFVCRRVTERPEALDTSSTLIIEPQDLPIVFNGFIDNYKVTGVCPFGKGDSAQRVYKILKKVL